MGLILTVNVGSSSVRLAAFGAEGRAAAALRLEGSDLAPERLERFLVEADLGSSPGGPSAVVHRIVHGGPRLRETCELTPEVLAELERAVPLAPLHLPPALAWVRLCQGALGTAVQLGAFDTAFFEDLPAAAATLPLDRELCRSLGLRRYGFHGLAHRALWRRWTQLHPELPGGGRLVTLQLGSGCSATAIAAGRPRDTSMGLTPLEGLMMATRPGDLDVGTLVYLLRRGELGLDALEGMLYRCSGLLGVSGRSGDVRALLEGRTSDDRLALEMFTRGARKYVAAYLAVLEGAEGIVIGGGVGEAAPRVRAEILRGLRFCGVRLDLAANDRARGGEARISTPDSPVEVWVTPVDEAAELAAEGRSWLAGR